MLRARHGKSGCFVKRWLLGITSVFLSEKIAVEMLIYVVVVVVVG